MSYSMSCHDNFWNLWSRYFVSVVGMISSEAAFFYLFLWHSSWKLFPTLEKASLNSSLLRTVIWCWDKAFSWFPFSLCSLLVSDIQLIRRTKGYLVHTVYNYKYCTTSHSGLKTISTYTTVQIFNPPRLAKIIPQAVVQLQPKNSKYSIKLKI